MSALRTLLETLPQADLTLENFDRHGKCVCKVDGPGLAAAVVAQRRAFRGWDVDGRKRVALLFKSEETIEFLVATFGALGEGFTVVPLYPNWSAESQREYLARYGIRAVAVGDGFWQRAEEWAAEGPGVIERLVPVSAAPESDAGGAKPIPADALSLDLPDDHPCAWIFTSGTSSNVAKCTEITVGNLNAAVENILQVDFLHPGMVMHSPLSASHIFAFVVILGLIAVRPRRLIFSDVQYLARLPEERTGKVDGLIMVPIVLNRMRAGFYEKLVSRLDAGSAPPGLEKLAAIPLPVRRALKRLTRFAEDSTIRIEQGRAHGWFGLPAIWLARKLFGPMFRKRLGSPGFVVVGGAKPNLQAMALLEVMGVRCLQGWGMTETTGPLAVCDLKDRFRGAFGTCGTLFGKTRASIEDSGELVVEGPQIARGYVEPDGTLVPFGGRKKTGDTAEFDLRGRLKVLGKASDRITTDNGLNYNPLEMEEELKAADLTRENVFEEIVVIGDGKPRLGAVFFLREGLERGAEVEAYVEQLLRQYNSKRAVDERIGPWKISTGSLKEVGGLGPSGKLVRRRIEEQFEGIYGEVLV